MANDDGRAPAPGFGMLRTIALYKLVKVLLLLFAAYGELRLHDASLSAKLVTWAQARPAGLEHEIVARALQWFSGLSEARIHALRFVTFTYAAVFAVEGIGLWMQKRWAEWLTTIVTASLIPLEVWEFTARPNLGKAAVVIANAAIVGYLVWHVLARGRQERGAAGAQIAAARGADSGGPATGDQGAGAPAARGPAPPHR
jgi:uncharacterized membrane protein (DUF2068 family)